jgi:hypothetical protein
MSSSDESWNEQRAKFQARFDTLAEFNIQKHLTELNSATAKYIKRGGLSQDPNNNGDYKRVQEIAGKIADYKSQLSKLNNDILQSLSKVAKDADLSGLLSKNGELQTQIQQLEKIEKETKVDVESAIARDELLRSYPAPSRHNLFLLNRPIKNGVVPYLWLISIIFIAIGFIVFWRMIPPIAIGSTNGGPGGFDMIKTFVMDTRIWMTISGASLIVIIFLSLKIAGVFGK